MRMASPKAAGLSWEITWLAFALYAHLQVGNELVAVVIPGPVSGDLAAHFALLFLNRKLLKQLHCN